MFISIWCEDSKRGIGKNNKLPWNISEEISHFRKTTLNHTILMGKNTFLSIGKPLPKRENIILSKSLNGFKYKDVKIFDDYQEIIDKYKNSSDIVYVIGGKQIYDLFIPLSSKLIVSKLKQSYSCDIFMDNNFDNFSILKIENYSDFDIYYYESNNNQ